MSLNLQKPNADGPGGQLFHNLFRSSSQMSENFAHVKCRFRKRETDCFESNFERQHFFSPSYTNWRSVNKLKTRVKYKLLSGLCCRFLSYDAINNCSLLMCRSISSSTFAKQWQTALCRSLDMTDLTERVAHAAQAKMQHSLSLSLSRGPKFGAKKP